MTVFPPGASTVRGFTVGGRYGLQAAAGHGVRGAGGGPGGSVLRLAPRSSTSAGAVPTVEGTTNPLYVLQASGGRYLQVAGFTVEGTPQGHLYNGVRVERSTRPTVSEVRVTGVPGGSDVNPGETFLLNLWRCTDVSVHDVELDGAGVGASGLGLNSCTGRFHVRDVTAHHLRWCKGAALWQHDGDGVFTGFESLHNAFGLGLERCDGTYTLDRPKFVGSTRADVHLGNDGGKHGRTRLVVRDPVLKPGQQVTVLVPPTELGRPNLVRRSDVTLTVAGEARPDLLRFVSRA